MMSDVRELLAAATARPWFRRDPTSPWSDITSKENNVCVMSDGGRLVTGARPDTDADLIVRAVNEYEALLDVTAAAGAVLDYEHQPSRGALSDLRGALARLDEVRGG